MRRIHAILAAATALLLVSGCGAASGDHEHASEVLNEAVATLKGTAFEFTYNDHGSMTISGSYDPVRRQGEYTSTQTWVEPGMDVKYGNQFMTVSRLVAGNRYEMGWFGVRFGEKKPRPAGPPSWCRTGWLADGNPYLDKSYDPAKIPETLREAIDVRRQGNGGVFTGRVNSARVSSPRPLTMPADQSPPVKTVPFEAAVDGNGRLVRYSIDRSELLGSIPTAKLDYNYSAFGIQVEVTVPPAAETKPC